MQDQPTKWYYEYITPELFQASHLTQTLYSGRTPYQQVEVIETAPFGRCLVLDGRTQSSEADEFVYHETLVHPALTTLTEPHSVFIAGGGEGATAREVLSRHSVQRVVMVDLDREVVELCQKYLPRHHQGAFQDPRLELIFADAWQYLANSKESFDLIVMDIPDPLESGPAYLLFTKEFYTLARSRLNPEGLLVVQAGPCGPLNFQETFTAIHHTLADVFPAVYPYRCYMPSFGSPWGFILASLGPVPTNLSEDQVDHRLSKDLARDLHYYDGVTHKGLFYLPKYIRKGIGQETRLITKENPLYAV